jgi:GMP synthase (glutamine-hydrolysing)
MKTALIIRHVPYEGIAGFRAPIEAAGFAIERIDVTDPQFPETDFIAPDLIAVMGGPMGVYDVVDHPWIAGEVLGLRRRMQGGRPTLGVCLGSQMIAAALGARVYPGPAKEIGFAPVTLNAAGENSPLRHLAGVPILHWHGDTFDLPPDVELLASTPLYAHQAFRRGPNVLALQCHPEMGEDPRIEAWIAGSTDCLAELQIDGAGMRANYAAKGPAAVVAGRALIGEWLAGLEY